MEEDDVDHAVVPNTCFVIGPIGSRLAKVGSVERAVYEESLRVMEEVIGPACAAVGLEPVRADGLARAGEITEQIFRRLRDDDVVIADLTGANANVMYELGLRHTRDKLTVQIGEFGRLPFDVNTIRTIQFSSSAIGLINARDELIEVLRSGLAGDYDPVSATRLWSGEDAVPDVADPEDDLGPERELERVESEGFLDIMARAEEQAEAWLATLGDIGEIVRDLGNLAVGSSAEMEKSDASGRGMRGRLQVTTRFAAGLDQLADRFDPLVDEYVEAFEDVAAGNDLLIARMESDQEALAEGQEFGLVLRGTAESTREGMAQVADLVASVQETAGASKVLKRPAARLTTAFARFIDTMDEIDEWDRRLQALGIPIPPPEPDEGTLGVETDEDDDQSSGDA